MKEKQFYETPELELVSVLLEDHFLDGSGKKSGYDGDEDETWG